MLLICLSLCLVFKKQALSSLLGSLGVPSSSKEIDL